MKGQLLVKVSMTVEEDVRIYSPRFVTDTSIVEHLLLVSFPSDTPFSTAVSSSRI